jgi:uncharacterized repeat protein (TIGR03803 family)
VSRFANFEEEEPKAKIVPTNRLRREIMLRKTFLMKRSAKLVLLFFGVLLGAAWAQTESLLYSFCARENCNDGSGPYAGVVFDEKGNLYGTTYYGGPYNECFVDSGCGVMFKLTPDGRETVLHSFCARGYPCTDGADPSAGLIFDQKGNLYGTTQYGGTHGEGVVFKLTPEGKYAVLYSFCAHNNCADGYDPLGLVFDQKGNLYGMTQYGGAYGAGVVFKLTPEGKETVLYSFCTQGYPCIDGQLPVAGLVIDQMGNLYGTTLFGGPHAECYTGDGCGVVFKLTPEGKETVLYSFCAQTSCTDGAEPYAGVAFDQIGNLYGTTYYGGAYGAGAVFKLTPKGKQTILYSFCPQRGCTDGQNPYAALVLDLKGNLYGTTVYGGPYYECAGYAGCGVVFKLTPKGKETVLYSFCAQSNTCGDGANPYAGLLFDQKGNLYGTTYRGGTYGSGAVFKLAR